MKNPALKKYSFYVALVCILLAVGIHLYLNKHHVDLKMGTGSADSVCNINAKLNCDTAAASPYAEVFGVSIALLGAFTNLLLLTFLLITHFNMSSDTEKTGRYTFYLSGFIFAVSLVMGAISLFILKSGCPFCMSEYALSLIILISLWFYTQPNLKFLGSDIADMFSSEKWVLGCAVAVPVLALVINSMILDSAGFSEIQKNATESLDKWRGAPAQNFDLTGGLQYQNGTETAKVVIVEFADFLCPHCKAAYPGVHKFAQNHPDVKLIFKSFPLDGICNTAVHQSGDGKRCDLAYATYCSEKLAQKGWAAHNYIFDNQEEIFSTPMEKVLGNICQQTGVDCGQMKTCISSEEAHEAIKRMATEGEKAQIGGTPSVFFNNKALPLGQLLPILESTYTNYAK